MNNTQAPRTVLIVEDCAEDRDLYRRYLQESRDRYQILEAETGADAIALVNSAKIDAVLLDNCLPDYSGLELLSVLQTKLSYQPPIIVATGQGSETLAVDILKAGAEDYLIKGHLTAAKLQTAIATAIEKAELRLRIHQGEKRERLVAQVAQQIRQSLDFKTILETTVEAVRQLFRTSRVLIFQLHADGSGTIIAESVGAAWRSVLNETLVDPCLVTTYIDRYQQGRVMAVADIHQADLNPCHVAMLETFQVQANLVVPILQGPALWGLLIAHHCVEPRTWQIPEIELLKQLSVQVGNAIQQAELYQQAQTELTERRRVEMELRESEYFKQQILDSSYECIKVLDLDGTLLFMNAGGQRQMDIQDFSQVAGCQWVEFWQNEHRQAAEAAIATAKSGGIGRFEGKCPTAKGTMRWWEVQVSPIYDIEGNLERLLSVSRDTTDRKQVEMRLRRGSDRIQLLYEMTSDLLVSDQPLALIDSLFEKLKDQLDLDLYLNFLITEEDECKMRLASYFGISADVAEDFKCLSLGQGVCGAVAEARQQMFFGDIQNSEHPEVSLIRPLGITAYASQPLIAQGQLFGTLSFGSCRRTHFTKAETELLQALCDQIAIALERSNLIASLQQQTEQLRKADQLKDEFLAVLSHELRTPLNPILGWTKLLQSQKLDLAKAKDALNTIERNAKLQSQLIEDLLDISRIMRGKLTLEPSPVNPAFVIAAALETVRLSADAKQIHLVAAIGAQVGVVSGDAGRLQQVIWNLLSNAVKFTPSSGQIEVRLSAVEDSARIQVIDNGKGIRPDFLPYLFDYFRQEDGSTTRKFGGLGLGLAIAKQIVELHGGRIWAESAGEGCGATFTVELPVVKKTATPVINQQTVEAADVPLNGIRVLAVDDDADSLEFIAFLLESSGVIVTTCNSAALALQRLEQDRFDALLSDIGMPGMDGYELIQKVRARGNQVPAIALTAYAGEGNQQQAIAAGFQSHLAKPLDPDQVITVVSELVVKDASQRPITDTLKGGNWALK
jgi:PAS domain S-box-containing protein